MGLADELKKNTLTHEEIERRKIEAENKKKQDTFNSHVNRFKQCLSERLKQITCADIRQLKGFFKAYYHAGGDDPYYYIGFAEGIPTVDKPSDVKEHLTRNWRLDELILGFYNVDEFFSYMDDIAASLKQWLIDEGFDNPTVRVFEKDIWTAKDGLFGWRVISSGKREKTIYVELSW